MAPPPDVISPQLCAPKVGGGCIIQLTEYNLRLKWEGGREMALRNRMTSGSSMANHKP
jgi:hypothetical protein